MKFLDWIKKAYSLEGLTWPKIFLVTIFTAILIVLTGFFQSLGQYLFDSTMTTVPSAIQIISQAVLSFLFYPVNTNLLTVIVGVIVFIPLYHYSVRSLLKRRVNEVVFSDDFSDLSPYHWSGPYWGGNVDTVKRASGYIVFSAKPGSDWTRLHPDENGALIDLKNGIFEGFTYQVKCQAKSDNGTTMGFKLWVHDKGQPNAVSITDPKDGFETPGLELKDYSVRFLATKTNEMRIHLHCRAGAGRILVKEVTVTKL